MKRFFLLLVTICLLVSACMKDSVTEHYTFYRPVYATREDTKNGIKSSTATAIHFPGKIVVRGHYVFLNEVDKGIHVIDIADPAKPANIAFIAIPGCVDLAVNGNYLYADCYKNLVTLDITDPANVVLKQFLDDAFPTRYYADFTPDNSKLIKEWVRVDTAVSKRFSGKFSNGSGGLVYLAFSSYAAPPSSLASSGGVAIAGSLARFAIQNNRMYTVSNVDLKVFNITTAASPSFVSSAMIGQGNIETIFPYKDKLFIGSQTGMHIYDASNPDQPKKYSEFTHARTCDPVIADDKYAYVTLSSGSACAGFNNQLDVVDISSLTSPKLVKTYNLTSPKGLSKDGNILLICDGSSGLKIFDAANASQVSMLGQVTGFEPKDIIALQGTAIAVAKDGLYFIDYSNPANPSVISKILISQNK